MNSPFLVRPARLPDIASVLDIDAVCESASHWSRELYLQVLATGHTGTVRRRLLVAAGHGGQVLGFVVFSAVTLLQPLEVELENLAVAPAARQRGVGRALVQAVTGWAAELGGGLVRLEVRSQNNAALRLYQASGFVSAGLRRGYYAHPPDDAVCMELAIPMANPQNVALDGVQGPSQR